MGAPASNLTQIPQRASFQIILHWGLRLQHMNMGDGGINIQSITSEFSKTMYREALEREEGL